MREVFEVGQLVRSVWDGDYGIVYKREHKLGGVADDYFYSVHWQSGPVSDDLCSESMDLCTPKYYEENIKKFESAP
jgi:hypothetical protein